MSMEKNMSTEKTPITVRLDSEMVDWLKKKSKNENSNISDLVRESVLLLMKTDNVPENMKFSDLLNVQGSKASIMTYQLLAYFVSHSLGKEEGKELIDKAGDYGKNEIEKWR